MFKDLLRSLQEAFGKSSPKDFDTSDTPSEGPAQKPKGPPKSIPLKAMRNVQKPMPRRLPGVHAKPSLPPKPKYKYFESLIAEARSLVEGGGSRRSKASRQAALMKHQGFEATPARGLDDPEKKAAARDAHSTSGPIDTLRIRAKAAKLTKPDPRNPYPAATRGPLGKLKLWPQNKSESVIGEGGGSRASKFIRQVKFAGEFSKRNGTSLHKNDVRGSGKPDLLKAKSDEKNRINKRYPSSDGTEIGAAQAPMNRLALIAKKHFGR